MSKHVVLSGGAGFIGHHFVEHFLKTTDWKVSILDKLTYASTGFDRLKDIYSYDNKRVTIYTYDINVPISQGLYDELSDANYILHLAAETHVDNSITDPMSFVMSNVVGTANLLEFARKLHDNGSLEAFHYFGTDEIFGPATFDDSVVIDQFDRETRYKLPLYKEWDRYDSTNPYSATKAGAEELCLSYANTYGLPLFITHTMNCFGERQHPEKFFPMTIKNVLEGNKVIIHSNADKTISGTRFYIHCRNVADAVLFLINKFDDSVQREKFNIVGEREVSNFKLAEMIAECVGKPLKYEFVDFHSSRPGHDLRYGLDGTKMKNIGWQPPLSFEKSLETAVKWSLDNRNWL